MAVIIRHTQPRDGCDAPPESWPATCVFLVGSDKGGGVRRGRAGIGRGESEISHEEWLEAAGGMAKGGKHPLEGRREGERENGKEGRRVAGGREGGLLSRTRERKGKVPDQ